MPLEEVGTALAFTRERSRQVEEAALAKVREADAFDLYKPADHERRQAEARAEAETFAVDKRQAKKRKGPPRCKFPGCLRRPRPPRRWGTKSPAYCDKHADAYGRAKLYKQLKQRKQRKQRKQKGD